MSPYPRGGQNSLFYKEFYRETAILAGGGRPGRPGGWETFQFGLLVS